MKRVAIQVLLQPIMHRLSKDFHGRKCSKMVSVELQIWYFLSYLLVWMKAVIGKDLPKKTVKCMTILYVWHESLWTYIHISAHSFFIMTLGADYLDGVNFASEGVKTQRNYTS